VAQTTVTGVVVEAVVIPPTRFPCAPVEKRQVEEDSAQVAAVTAEEATARVKG